jgi:two-component system response regulator (stage 0 sporulation protein A)
MPKILIADDNEQILKFLSTIISQEPDLDVCGLARNGRQAVQMARELAPDAVILDLQMPLLDGLGATVEIVKLFPLIPILLYTVHKNEQIDREAKKVGVRQVIAKTDPPQSLLASIRAVLPPAPAKTSSTAAPNVGSVPPLLLESATPDSPSK